MAEGKYVPCECARKLTTADAFLGGTLDFPCQVGAPNGLDLSRSYFRVGMSLYGGPNAGVAAAPSVREMIAFADNAVGNLFDKAEVTVNNQKLSSINQGLPQASALRTRLGNSSAWLKSLGSPELHEANFPKRVNASAFNALPGGTAPALQSDNEIYKPVVAGTFGTANVSISAATTTTLSAVTNVTQAAATTASFVRGPLSAVATDPVVLGAVANPYSAITLANSVTVVAPLVVLGAANNALATFTPGGVVTGVNTLFATGMPGITSGAPTGGTVLTGDILVIHEVYYPIVAVASNTALTVVNPPSVAIAATTNWYIIRKDVVRSPQAKNTVYAVWRPPMGIFDYDGILGCGNYTFSLYPNSRYLTSAVETRNLSALPSVDGKTNDYSLIVNSITFCAYVAKVSIPDSIIDIPMLEF